MIYLTSCFVLNDSNIAIFGKIDQIHQNNINNFKTLKSNWIIHHNRVFVYQNQLADIQSATSTSVFFCWLLYNSSANARCVAWSTTGAG